MRILVFIPVFLTAGILALNAQVKIGDNPQNIDVFSLLELESGSKSLVITRVSDVQMRTMSPLNGAMVYNTDESCIFYFNGAEWNNLCDNTTIESFELVDTELTITDSNGNTLSVTLDEIAEQTFSSNPIVNFRESIVITQEGNNYNFEVGQITGENIVDSSINGIDFQDNSITANKLAPNSVGQEELQDNTVGDLEIDYGQVTLNDFTNDAGFITSAQLISANPNNAIVDDNGAFYDDSVLQTTVANTSTQLTQHLADDTDLDPDNERLSEIVVDGTELVFTEGGVVTRVDLGSFAGSDDQNLDEVLTQGNDAGGSTISNLGSPNLATDAATRGYVDDAIAGVTGGGGADGNDFVNAGNLNVESLELTGTGGAGATIDLSAFALDTDLTGFLTTEVDGSISNELTDIEFDADTNILSLSNSATPGGASVDLSALDGGNGTTELADGTTILGTGTDTDRFQVGEIGSGQITDGSITSNDIANGTILAEDFNQMGANDGQILKWDDGANAGAGGWVIGNDRTDGTGIPSLTNGTILIGDDLNEPVERTISGDATINNTGALMIEVDAIEASMINANVAGDGLQQVANGALALRAGTADDQILKWDGDSWELTEDVGSTLTNGQIYVGDDNNNAIGRTMDGDAEISNTGQLTIKTDAVEASMINPNVAGDGLQQNATDGSLELISGTIANQVLKWNNTTNSWELGEDIGTNLFNGQIYIGDDTNNAVGRTMDGDAEISNTGQLTIKADAVEASMINPDVAGDGLQQNATDGSLELISGTIANQILKWNNNNGSWELGEDIGTTLINGQIYIGDDTNNAVGRTIDGDAEISNTGQLTLKDDVVEASMINPNVAGDGLQQNITDGSLELISGNVDNQILKWNGNSWVLGFDVGNTLLEGQIYVGNNLNIAVGRTMDGDAEISNTGQLEIKEDAIEASMINPNVAGNGLQQNGTNGSLELISGTTNNQILKWDNTTNSWELGIDVGNTLSNGQIYVGNDLNTAEGRTIDGDAEISNTGQLTIKNNAVEALMLNPNVAGNGIQKNNTDGSLELISGTANNQILKWDGSSWGLSDDIAPGTANQFLRTNAAGNAVEWFSLPGTLGSVFYSDGNGGFDSNPNNIFWDNTNGRLGIGTITPDRKLDVEGEIRGNQFSSTGGNANEPAYSFSTNDDSNTGMFRAAPDQLGFSTGANEALRIDDSQNIGIGTDTPNAKLHVAGTSIFDGDMTLNGLINGTAPPDYVFEKYFKGSSDLKPEYTMPSLKEVENFTRLNNHLPGIPSASHIMENGLVVNKALFNHLEKIEELFLHTIEQEKKIESLKEENKKLGEELKVLKKDMALIKQLLLENSGK